MRERVVIPFLHRKAGSGLRTLPEKDNEGHSLELTGPKVCPGYAVTVKRGTALLFKVGGTAG
jgi:hypothetical protein